MRGQVARIQPNTSGEPTLAWSRADLHWGAPGNKTTDGTGSVVITHGLGWSPSAIFIQMRSTNPYTATVNSINGSTFTVSFLNSTTGNPAAGAQTVNFFWLAFQP